MNRILIVDDEPNLLAAMGSLLTDAGYEVLKARSGDAALQLIAEERPALLITDIWMPYMNGLELCERAREINPALPAIMVTGKGTPDIAIEASKTGVVGYLEKPFDPALMLQLISDAMESLVHGQVPSEPERDPGAAPENGMVGRGAAMQEVYRMIGRVARTEASVLVRGESGTGKELVAKAIWRHSSRAGKPLHTLNCVAIPETLLESELFGYERGAFTGAVARKLGKFEQAEGGTILLDEIADVSLAVQAKILRVLQEKTFERVGGNETLQSDVRILAATNRDLEAGIRTGRFREDLYHRLHVVTIRVPPLRERREDIELLVRHSFRRFARQHTMGTPHLSPDALRIFTEHSWPGNVRELEHCIQRILLLTPGSYIRAKDVLDALERGNCPGRRAAVSEEKALRKAVNLYLASHHGQGTHDGLVSKVSRLALMEALRSQNGNRTRAAAALGIPRPTLHAKMNQFGIRVGFRPEGGRPALSGE